MIDEPSPHDGPSSPPRADESESANEVGAEAHPDDAGAIRLSPLEARVLGAMAEKALATPQNYPLSLNALVTACNQTTNRDPITDHGEQEVADLLPDLKSRGLLRYVHPTSGRGVTKYRHVLDEAMHIGDDALAVLSVLLVRGPQTAGELRTRTERLADFDSVTDIEELLGALVDGEGNSLAMRLEREPGRREPRWAQLLCPEQGVERAGAPDVSPRAARGGAEVEELREQLDSLRRDHDELRAAFEAFRAEFG